ncbi:MAG TPA: ATP-binding protein [Spirochaetota bacterium]|nr:ATP-binding protein [Spirochaetota bacterium]
MWITTLIAIDLFLMIYFLFTYYYRREHYYLHFSLLSFTLGIWTLGYHGLVFFVIDNYILYIIVTYVGAIGVCIFFILFLHSFLKIRFNKFTIALLSVHILLIIIIIIELITTGHIVLFNKYIFNFFILSALLVLIYGDILCIYGITKKIPFATQLFVGTFLLSLSYAISVIVFLEIAKIFIPLSEGFFLMTIIFASTLAVRFSQVHTDLEKAHSDLLVLDKMKNDFLATTTHELRTPLHGIMGITESIADGTLGPVNEEQKENLELVKSCADQLNGLVGEILDFSKIRAGKVDLILERFSPGDVIGSVVSLLRMHAESKGIGITLDAGALPHVSADKNRIRQVLLNLVGNAVKYTERGAVTVKAEPEGARAIRVTVSDTGPGISPKDMGRIWSPFDRGGDADTRGTSGTGLGLAIAKEIVELHGGSIDAQSKPGEGSTFSFVLPVEPDITAIAKFPSVRTGVPEYREVEIKSVPGSLSPSPDEGAGEPEIEPGVRVKSSTASILAVDDDPVNLKVLENLCRVAGYRLITAPNGPEALQLLKEGEFDLILLDLMLPGMSGYEVCGRIRSDTEMNWTPVIMITARDSIADLLRGFDRGANDYITKPFNRDEVLMRIENQLAIRQLMEMEKSVANGLRREKDSITSLFQRSMDLKESTIQMIEWEKIIKEDLDIAKSFQMKLMTNETGGSGVDSYVYYEPLLRIGGDVYDLFQIRPGVVRIFCADATGHGIAASLNTVKILSEYSAVKDSIDSPAEIVTHLNRRFSAFFRDYQIIFTCVIADIDATVGSITVSCAGHPDQFLISPDGGARVINKRGPIIGLYKDFGYTQDVYEMRLGDMFFLYSDGLLNLVESYKKVLDHKLMPDGSDLLNDIMPTLDHTSSLKFACNDLLKRFDKSRKSIDDDITIILARIG